MAQGSKNKSSENKKGVPGGISKVGAQFLFLGCCSMGESSSPFERRVPAAGVLDLAAAVGPWLPSLSQLGHRRLPGETGDHMLPNADSPFEKESIFPTSALSEHSSARIKKTVT
jgi:hypothetical protein